VTPPFLGNGDRIVIPSKRFLRRESLPLSEVEGNLGEPREASQPALSKRSAPKGSLRRINRAFGSSP
jgi:hypothetical protein